MKNSFYILLLTGSVLFFSCARSSGDEVIAPESNPDMVTINDAQMKSADIRLGAVARKKVNATLKVNGMLDVPPQNLVSISVAYGGFLKSTDLLQGMQVKKGQVIAMLEHPDYVQMQQDYLENAGQLTYLESEYERQDELRSENVNSQKTFEKAKADFLSTDARVKGLRAKLEMLNVNIKSLEAGNIQKSVPLFSPIDGYVTKVNVSVGAYINPADILFEIIDSRHLHAELTMYEKDVPFVRVGQKVRIQLVNEDEDRMASVYLIGREIGKDHTVRVHCHFDEEDNQLLPGTYLRAFIETEEMEGDALPVGAVLDYEGKHYVFIEANKQSSGEAAYQFELTEVKTGAAENGFVHVEFPSTINPEKIKVVINGGFSLLSQLKGGEGEE